MDSHSTGQVSRKTGKTSAPDWGKHETAGGKTGKLWRKVKSWFGLHVDTRYEIPVAFSVTQASRAEELDAMMDRLFKETPLLAGSCKDFSAESGARQRTAQGEAGAPHPSVDAPHVAEPDYDPDNVRPLFDDNVTERGEVLCRCPETNTERHMARLRMRRPLGMSPGRRVPGRRVRSRCLPGKA